jgi:hypothetical protein
VGHSHKHYAVSSTNTKHQGSNSNVMFKSGFDCCVE